MESGKEAETPGFLSARLSRTSALPVPKDENNHGLSWLIVLGDFDGGRLWLEDPLGSQPPPKCTHAWEKNLRGNYDDVKDKWFQFNPSTYHAVEEVTRGVRRSIALFSPRSWTRILPNSLSELADVGFFPPRSAMSTQLLDQIDHIDFKALPAEEDHWTGAIPDSEDIIQLTTPTQEKEKEIQEWCVSEHVALPFNLLERNCREIRGSDQDLGFKMPQRVRTTRGVLDTLCPICCTESDLFSPSTQAAFTTVWVDSDSDGARPQGHQAHSTQVHYRTTSLLGPPARPSDLPTVESLQSIEQELLLCHHQIHLNPEQLSTRS